MFALVGISLKTTNCIESLNASAKDYCSNIDSWKNSSQKNRKRQTNYLLTQQLPGMLKLVEFSKRM